MTGSQFIKSVISGANNIGRRKQLINELNVFPVPDGDTGTNMFLTISATYSIYEKYKNIEDVSISEAAGAIASAMIRNARGNSGVILSLLFKGIAAGCKDKETLDAKTLADAMNAGVQAAYKAVLKPTEGTVLTVSRMASIAAKEAAAEGASVIETFEAALNQGESTLASTPDMLPMLKKAGVVDAGGKGYVTILEGMIEYLKTGVIVEATELCFDGDSVADPEIFSEEEITFTYCTEFIVARDSDANKNVDDLISYLGSIGDSVVVVDADEIIKAHVHTDHPGKAFEKALEYGMLEKVKVDNMRLQFRNRVDESTSKKQENAGPVAIEKEYGIVAVAAGKGVEEVFRNLGCDSIVSGGQTMNPSTDDILAACLATPAKTVFVLPNNKNIVMSAEQAIPLTTERKIVVIPTKTIPQGVSAAMAFDDGQTVDEIFDSMSCAAHSVHTGQITNAVRDSEFDGQTIKMGQILALNENKISFVHDDINEAALRLTKELYVDGSEFITVFYGADISEDDANTFLQMLNDSFSNAEITLICGGQSVYHYIISVE